MFCFLWCNMCLCQSIIYHCNVPPPNIMSSSHIYSLSYGYRDYSIYQIVKKNTRCKTTLFSYLTTESTRFHAFQNGRAPYTNGPMNLRLVPAITYKICWYICLFSHVYCYFTTGARMRAQPYYSHKAVYLHTYTVRSTAAVASKNTFNL